MKAPRASFTRRASWWLRGGGYRLCRRDHLRHVASGALRAGEVPALSAIVAIGMLPGLRWAMAALYVLMVTDRPRVLVPAWSRTVFAAVCFGAPAAAGAARGPRRHGGPVVRRNDGRGPERHRARPEVPMSDAMSPPEPGSWRETAAMWSSEGADIAAHAFRIADADLTYEAACASAFLLGGDVGLRQFCLDAYRKEHP